MSVKSSKSENILKVVGESKINDKSLISEMEGSFLDYSMSVIKSRALPDYRDGLKPVHRRIIYSAFKEKLVHDSKYKKSAAIVGSVMASYHPHGDASIYDALVRMAQDFSMRYPLIDGQGNFGSIDGDSPAAMRYTEARLSRISNEFLEGIDEDWVEMMDNYDQSKKEPVVLPTLIPNVLINGGEGIAVGLATKIPPHNLTEVINATLNLLDNPNMSDEDVENYILGPDFPTGGELLKFDGVKDYFLGNKNRKRNVSFRLRAKARIEQPHVNKRSQIIIEEIPYGVKKEAIIKSIVALATPDKKKGRYVRELGENIIDIRDESNRDSMRLIIEVRPGYPPKVVLNNLYKYTRLQVSYAANLTVLIDKEPKRLSILEILKKYLEYQFEILKKRTKFSIGKLSSRIHILEGRLRVVGDIMEAIRIITSVDDSDKELQSKYSLSVEQLKDIFSLPIGRLRRLSINEMIKELNDKRVSRSIKETILGSEEKQRIEIKNQLRNILYKYGKMDSRRTVINRHDKGIVSLTDLKHLVSTVFMLSKKSFLSQIPLSEFKARKRENTGTDLGAELYKDDAPRLLLACHGRDDLLFFSADGKVYKRKAYELDLGSGKKQKGSKISNLLKPINSEGKDFYMISLTDEEYRLSETSIFFDHSDVLNSFNLKFIKNVISLDLGEFKTDNEKIIDKLRFGLEDKLEKTRLPDIWNLRFSYIELKKDIKVFVKKFIKEGSSEFISNYFSSASNTIPNRSVIFENKSEKFIKSFENLIAKYFKSISNDSLFLIFVTEKGMVKKTSISEFRNINKKGKIAVGLKKGDRLKFVVKARNGNDLCLSSSSGKLTRCLVSSFRILTRKAAGRQGIKLNDSDLTFATSTYGDSDIVVSISKYGRLNFTSLQEYKLHPRGNTAGVNSQKKYDEKNKIKDHRSKLQDLGSNISSEFISQIGNKISKDVLESYKDKIYAQIKQELGLSFSKEEFDKRVSELISEEFWDLYENIDISLDDYGDTIACMLINRNDEIFLMSDKNRIKRFQLGDTRLTGRNSRGVRSIFLDYESEYLSNKKYKEEVWNANINGNVTFIFGHIQKKYKEKIVYWTKRSPDREVENIERNL